MHQSAIIKPVKQGKRPGGRSTKGKKLTPGGLVVVYIDALQLEVGVALIVSREPHTVLIAHHLCRTNLQQPHEEARSDCQSTDADSHLPELRTDLIAALASLDVHNLPHLAICQA